MFFLGSKLQLRFVLSSGRLKFRGWVLFDFVCMCWLVCLPVCVSACMSKTRFVMSHFGKCLPLGWRFFLAFFFLVDEMINLYVTCKIIRSTSQV